MPNVGYATLQVIPSVRGIANELRQQLVGPAEQAGQDAGEASGGGFRGAFEGALAALGVAAIAEKAGEVFTEAFDQAVEQGNVTGKLQAQLGASSADASRYGKVVGQLYSKGITESFEQGAETVRALVSTGLVDPTATNKQLASIATHMQDVATTFGTDMTLQTQAVSALLRNGLAPSADAALDVITGGFQRLGPAGEDLLETFQEYPIQLKKLGLDARTSLGLFSQGMRGGARDTDIIADSLKEFSIRAIDMSASSQTAYEQLGLSAKGMSLQIAKGGASATAGLQTVLDRLRAIDDPVKREAAAVGLFGTQAEDLGAALFGLDPSKAVDALGDVSGAATQLGADLRSGPSYQITLFKRTVQQGLVNFIGGQVLPILARWGGTFNEDVLPPLTAVGGVLDRDFLPAVHGAADAVRTTAGFTQEWGVWLTPLGILLGGVTLALTAGTIATGISTAAWDVWIATIGVGELVAGGFTGAMTLLNTAMEANPILLAVTAALALAAAVYIAYKRSETFRGIVQGAWQGIQTAAQVAWRTALKPTVDALVAGWQAIAAGALWLWHTVLQPTFEFIRPVALVLATIIGVTLVVAFKTWWFFTSLYIDGIVLAFKGLAAAGQWLYSTILQPIIALIIFNLKLWYTAAKLFIEGNIAVFRALAAVAVWLYGNVLKPTAAGIIAAFRLLGAAGVWLYQTALSPAFRGIATVAQWLYDRGIKPPLDKGKQLAKEFGAAFTAAKNTIGAEWGKLEGIARKPIQFIIDTVYNHGLVGVWNKVASAFGAPKLDTFKFATGGPVHGAGTETSDDVPAWLSRNEHVWTAREVRGAGGHGAVAQLRAWAAAGGFRNGTPGFKGGGAFGWIGRGANAVAGAGSAAWNKAKDVAGWLKDTLAASARAGVRAVVNPLLDRIPGLDTLWGQMARRLPQHMIDALFGYADQADRGGASSSTAGGVHASPAQAQAIARRMLAQFGFGPGQMGPLTKLWNGESGWRWNADNPTSDAYGIPQSLPASKMASAGKDWHDNAATQIKWGLGYIKGRYGDPGTAWESWNSHSPHWYDNGGPLGKGLTLAANGTGQTEFVLTNAQYRAAAAAVQHAAAQGQAPAPAAADRAPAGGGLQAGQRLYLVLADGTQLDAYVDTRVDRSTSRTTTAARAGRRQ